MRLGQMNGKALLCLMASFCVYLGLLGQNSYDHGCASDGLLQERLQQDPALGRELQKQDNALYQLQRWPFAWQKTAGGPDTLPVVVHIIHNGGNSNIPDSQVQQAIDHLNAAYANVSPFDPNTGVDVGVRFCLATSDPQGNATTGINRVQSPLTNLVVENQDANLKSLIRWDPRYYINVWVVNEIVSSSMGAGVAGYSSFPFQHGQPDDGIVNEARYFGTTANDSKVFVHEMGHYLGLYHTFQGACINNDCLADGDKVCDTPPDNSTVAVTCGQSANTCSSDTDDLSSNNPFRPVSMGGLGDQPDMHINYMDYGLQACQSAFTQGQADRIQATVSSLRNSLLGSGGCDAPCLSPITALFTPSSSSVNAGVAVSFSNQSTGATNYLWEVNGMPFSSNANPSYTFNAGGSFVIRLIATNGDPVCEGSYQDTIEVTCPETASFTASGTYVNVGDTLAFTNTSSGGSAGFEWLVDGVSMANSMHFDFPVSAAGGYYVQLVSNGAVCSDTSLGYFVSAGRCEDKTQNHWFFGRMLHLDFNPAAPTSVPMINNGFHASEGCDAISDSSGNLLFYSDGLKAYNRNHQVMQNGDSLTGGGSSTQAVVIFPKAADPGKYYLFATPDFGGGGNPPDSLRYSIVDMSLAGGLGAITVKNVGLYGLTTEKLAYYTVPGTDTTWVITHEFGSNAFYTYAVNSAGIGAPVISNTGAVHNSSNGGNAIGCLKISPDGKRVAVVVRNIDIIELFDFDKRTGLLSNPDTIPALPIVQFPGEDPYGLEFSPNGRFLYTTYQYPNIGASLIQYDLSLGSGAQIFNNRIDLAPSNVQNTSYGGLQQGPDGKIYMSIANQLFYNAPNYYLSVIHNPNVLGTGANFVTNGIIMGPRNSNQLYFGLPYHVYPYAECSPTAPIGPDSVCARSRGITYRLASPCASLAQRSFEVEGPGYILSQTDSTVVLAFHGPGTVRLTQRDSLYCGMSAAQKDITVIPSDSTVYLGEDQEICQGASLTLDAGSGYSSYLWQNGSTQQSITVNSPGLYWCTVGGGSQCRPSDTVQVLASTRSISVDLGPDLNVCAGSLAYLDAGNGFGSYRWQDGSSFPQFTAWLPGTYWVTVTDSVCAGQASDTLVVNNYPLPVVYLGADTVLCAGDQFILDVGNVWGSVLWSDSSGGSSLTITQPGTYWVEVTDLNNCRGRDSLEVLVCTGLQDAEDWNLSVYPNPTEGQLSLRYSGGQKAASVQIYLRNPLGQEVLALREHLLDQQGEIRLDISAMSQGVYFLEIQLGDEKRVTKIILQ